MFRIFGRDWSSSLCQPAMLRLSLVPPMYRLFLLPLLPAIWLFWKAMRSRLPLWARLSLVVFLLAVSQLFNIQRFFFGSIAGPDLPAWVMVVQITVFCAMILTFFASLFWDAGSLLLRLVRRGRSRRSPAEKPSASGRKPDRTREPVFSRRAFLAGGSGAALCAFVPASLCLSGAGVAQALAVPPVRRWDVFLPALPEGLEGFSVFHLSDIHVGPLTGREKTTRLVQAVNAEKPDLICLSGDLADGDPAWRCADGIPRSEAARELAGLSCPLGVWACTGNHEYYSSYDAWMAIWEECGFRFLHNGHTLLEQKGAALLLGGLDDRVGGTRRPESEVFAGAPRGPDTFRLLMDHRPTEARLNARAGAQLQLSGHTHGGQCLGLEKVVARANRGFVRGWYSVKGMPLFVTAGAAQWSGFAMRLGIPPEAVLLRLHRTESQRFSARRAD